MNRIQLTKMQHLYWKILKKGFIRQSPLTLSKPKRFHPHEKPEKNYD
jgi:hypothetical protein